MDAQDSSSASAADAARTDTDLTTTVFPVSRIRKIVKEDPDVHNVSQEGIFLMTKAAEMFLEKLVWAASESADADKRKIVQYKDLVRASHSVDEFFFLEDILPEAPKYIPPSNANKNKANSG